MRLSSFERVKAWYDGVKPVISSNHTRETDVRPIGDRGRKWERIKKIDDDTYALCDGNYGNYIWIKNAPCEVLHAYENTMAPIVWLRRNGEEFIRIRNHSQSFCSVTRYNFLSTYLPSGLRFKYDNGKHWVHAHTPQGYEDFTLPKCKVKLDRNRIELHDDNIFLMFKVNGNGTFTRVSERFPVEVKRVDKYEKKQWRERIDNFYMFCAATAPMLDCTWSGKLEYERQLRTYIKERGEHQNAWMRDARDIPKELMREVITQEDHPMRVAVAVMVMYSINGKRQIESQEDIRSIRAAYNRLMNTAMGFYKTEEV